MYHYLHFLIQKRTNLKNDEPKIWNIDKKALSLHSKFDIKNRTFGHTHHTK